MKKFVMIGALLCLTACFVGCGETKDTVSYKEAHVPPKYATNEWREISQDGYMIADYEDEYECNNLRFGSSYFGKVSVSDEQKSNGAYSLKTEVYGYGVKLPVNREIPELCLLLKDMTGLKENPLLDIGVDVADYSFVAFDVYNAMDKTYYAYFSVNHDRQVTLELQRGWNHFEIPLGAYQQDEIKSFSFYFQRWEIAKEKQVYYIDNIRIGR